MAIGYSYYKKKKEFIRFKRIVLFDLLTLKLSNRKTQFYDPVKKKDQLRKRLCTYDKFSKLLDIQNFKLKSINS